VLLAKVTGDPLQEIAVVYWPLLESDVTGVAPVTGAVIVTLAVEIAVREVTESLVALPETYPSRVVVMVTVEAVSPARSVTVIKPLSLMKTLPDSELVPLQP
jgi:hypothetical protein